jgi:hypothetical protein
MVFSLMVDGSDRDPVKPGGHPVSDPVWTR